jgi:lipoate---protein ligase
MTKNIIHKVVGGKLIRLRLRLEDDVIKDIRITGDFFIYPESDIFRIEKALLGVKIGSCAGILTDFMKRNGTIITGFEPADLAEALTK